jgi:U-box domain
MAFLGGGWIGSHTSPRDRCVHFGDVALKQARVALTPSSKAILRIDSNYADHRAAMADIVSSTITLITACVNKYEEFYAFEEECKTFRRSLRNVVKVLKGVQKEIANADSSQQNTTLRAPMELLRAATTEGGRVLENCSNKRKLLAFVFSRQQMGMLGKAKADIEEAMRLLQASSVGIQVSTQQIVGRVSERLEKLNRQINASYASQNEVTELIRSEMRQHHERQGSTMAAALSDALVQLGVVSSPQDFAEQFAELRKEADTIRQAKVIYDEEMLEAVKALTAPREEAAAAPGPASPQRLGSESTSAVQECLICPISGEIMRDPVSVMESGLTYDRQSLCASLLLYPDLDPAIGQRFDRPLHYAPNVAIRKLLMTHYGDSYYQKYDDAEFKVVYDAIWKERLGHASAIRMGDHSGAGDVSGGGGSGGISSFASGMALSEPAHVTPSYISGSGGSLDDFGGIHAHSPDGDCSGFVEADTAVPLTQDVESPGVTFGDSKVPNLIATYSAEKDNAEEAAEPDDASKPGFPLWAAGPAVAVLIVIVAAVLVASRK